MTLLNNEVKKVTGTLKLVCRFIVLTSKRLGFLVLLYSALFRGKGEPLGFKTAEYHPFVSAEDMGAVGVQKMNLEEIISAADYLSVHVSAN